MRHGELTKKKCLVGHSDVELSEQGNKQMFTKLDHLFSDDHSISQIISSPLLRCNQIAKYYAKQYNIPLITEPNIKEMNFGDWDGLSFAELWQQKEWQQKKYQQKKLLCTIGDFWENPWLNTPLNGESMLAFTKRVKQWWLLQLKSEQPTTLVISHAGVIKYLLALITGLDPKINSYSSTFDVSYSSIIKIVIFQDKAGNTWPKIVF